MDGYQFNPSHGESLAIALSKVTGQDLMTDWVEITREPVAGIRTVTVVQEDVMAKVRPFVDEPFWTSIRTPMLAGYRIDGQRYHLNIAQHGQVIGGTTFGKSSLIHSVIAHATRCKDALVWVGGVQKLYDLVAGWVEPYQGYDLPLPIDWVANGQRDTCEMLAAAMRIGRYRQSLLMSERGGAPAIVCILDEARFTLSDTKTRVPFDGRMLCASELVADFVTGITSADCYLVLASQRDTNDQWGDQGGTTSANMGWAATFRIRDEGSIGRTMGDYKLEMPRHRGQYWLDAGDGSFPIQLKAPYLQTIDPSKPKLHDGATIADVAWTRRNFRVQMDSGSAAEAGESYARRHQRMTPQFQAYLTGTTAPVSAGQPTIPAPAQDGSLDRELVDALVVLRRTGEQIPDEILAQLDPKVLEAVDAELADPGDETLVAAARVTPMPPVASMEGRASWSDRILSVLRRADGPLTRGQIIDALRAEGHNVTNPQVISNALDKMRMPPSPALDRDNDGYRAL